MTSSKVGVAILAITSVVMATTSVMAGEPSSSSPLPTQSVSVPNQGNPSNSPAPPPTNDLHRMILDTMTLDLNQDGCIAGRPELEAFQYRVSQALAGTANSAVRAQGIVHRTDVNRDGRICWCDFISIYLHDRTNGGRHSFPFLVIPDSVLFTQLDLNKDGRLSGTERIGLVNEFATCLPLAVAQSIVAGMDATQVKDGSITLGEFAEYMKNPPPFQSKILELVTQARLPHRMGPPRPFVVMHGQQQLHQPHQMQPHQMQPHPVQPLQMQPLQMQQPQMQHNRWNGLNQLPNALPVQVMLPQPLLNQQLPKEQQPQVPLQQQRPVQSTDQQHLQQLILQKPKNKQIKTPVQQGDKTENHQSNQLPILPAKKQIDNSISNLAQEPQKQLASLRQNSH